MACSGGLILYGEWCYAKHTVPYDALPDWFLGFDIFEVASHRFWPADRRNEWLGRKVWFLSRKCNEAIYP